MQNDNREKIRKLKSEYMEKQTFLNEQRLKRRKGLYRRLTAFAVVFILIAIFSGVILFEQHQSIQSQKKTNEELDTELSKMEEEEVRLNEEIESLNDEEYIAEIARRDYFLTKEGETLFQLPRSQMTSD